MLKQFGSENDLRIYYDGNHSDFVDVNDRFSGTEGVYKMILDDGANGLDDGISAYSIGANWETQVETKQVVQ